jgi:hypothetical protein
MAKIDPEQERQRLQARFAAMSNLELQKVAKGYRGFTEWAFQVFGAEMDRAVWSGRGREKSGRSRISHTRLPRR